jgi:UMF1 family MFS transporter
MREHASPQPDAPVVGVLHSLRGLRQTLRDARPYQDFTRLLACAVAYQGGVAVAISLAAIYAEQVIGFQPQETMVLIFVLNMAAFLGAFVFGYAQDKIGHKLALALTLLGWILTCVIAALSSTKEVFWWAAAIAGLCMGSSQSSGRAMAGLMVPPARLGEFFGLWTFAIRLASILGPLSYGLITWLSGGNQRIAIGSTSLLFVVGLVLLVPINVERGRRMALGQD